MLQLTQQWALCLSLISVAVSLSWDEINLPSSHLSIYFRNNLPLTRKCMNDSDCPYKSYLNKECCWGYESNCSKPFFGMPVCPGDSRGWASSKEEQIDIFNHQSDFGYIKELQSKLRMYCTAFADKDSSALECTDNLQFCRGRNIFINFQDISKRKKPIRYDMDVLGKGQIGGKCRLNSPLLTKSLAHMSPLQSWAPELRNFEEVNEVSCDLWVEVPAVITKIDAVVNMYHHFCDFFNIYAAFHVNSTSYPTFSRNNQVLIWETYPYLSNFATGWESVTQNQVWNLNNVAGKVVCFKDVMFPLLPRMIFGLYYNTPLISGCKNSGLFRAFSEHFLYRLNLPNSAVHDGKIHITFLSRLTKFRRVLNKIELLKDLQANQDYLVRTVEYSHTMNFKLQLQQDQWTDIFIAMHGSGLTHLLFLPNWAVVFELYNCGDPNCYKDLTRLRGLQYMTWENNDLVYPESQGQHPDVGTHEKFTNYKFDAREFERLVEKAASYVRSNKEWKLKRGLQETNHDEL